MLISILIIFYAFLSILIVWGWFHLEKTKISKEDIDLTPFTILIAMRNESKNIPNLIECLHQINYPKEIYEVILIDDHSTDDSINIAKNAILSNLRIISSIGEGKKAAIRTGILEAKHEYIAQTDADCLIPKEWLNIIHQQIASNKVQLLAGPVLIQENNSIFSKLQALESYALIVTTAGLFGSKHPIMMNAANAVYQKSLLNNDDALNTKIASGDDVFLLHKVKKTFSSKDYTFIKDVEASILTAAETNLKAFWYQRIRWAGKSKHYKDADAIGIGAITILVNLALVLMSISLIFSPSMLKPILIMWGTKSILELMILIPVLRQYQKIYLLSYLPILALIYPFYVSFVGIIAQFANFKWKNRVYNGK